MQGAFAMPADQAAFCPVQYSSDYQALLMGSQTAYAWTTQRASSCYSTVLNILIAHHMPWHAIARMEHGFLESYRLLRSLVASPILFGMRSNRYV